MDYSLCPSSPDFIIFHLVDDCFGGKLGSLDQRYILNDEPLIIQNILNHYLLEEKTDQFLLLKKDTKAHFENPIREEPKKIKFNEWIDIPKSDNEIVRLKVSSKNTLLGKVKKMLYKEEEYYVDYMLEDGNIHTYRYIPGTAVDGLWCSPFVRNPLSDIVEPDAIKVRLRNSSSRYISPNVTIQFEKIKLKPTYFDPTVSSINSFHFKKTDQKTDTIIINNLISFSKEYSNIVKDGYSHTFVINLDTIWTQTDADYLTIETNVEFCNYSTNAGLVISLEGSDNDFWEVAYLPKSIRKNIWHHAFLDKKINRNLHGEGTLKVYVINFNKEAVYIDNFRTVIRKK